MKTAYLIYRSGLDDNLIETWRKLTNLKDNLYLTTLSSSEANAYLSYYRCSNISLPSILITDDRYSERISGNNIIDDFCQLYQIKSPRGISLHL